MVDLIGRWFGIIDMEQMDRIYDHLVILNGTYQQIHRLHRERGMSNFMSGDNIRELSRRVDEMSKGLWHLRKKSSYVKSGWYLGDVSPLVKELGRMAIELQICKPSELYYTMPIVRKPRVVWR